MKQSLIVTLLIFFAQISSFAGGDRVNNGAGASELIVVYAYQNYDSLVENCWRTTACDLGAEESKLLQEILGSLKQERNVALKFETSSELGEKLFLTSSQVGSAIKINKDRLWKSGPVGDPEAYTLSDALELLSSAWGQHHPQFKSEVLTTLAKKLATRALHGKTTYLPFFISSNMRILNLKSRPMGQMLLDDGYDSFTNLNPLLLPLLPCKASELSFFAFQWSNQLFSEVDSIRVLANGRIGWTCEAENSSDTHVASLTIVLRTVPVSGSIAEYLAHKKGPLKIVDQAEPELNLSNIQNQVETRAH